MSRSINLNDMKKNFVLMTFAVLSGLNLQAQSEKFDIASFNPPKGWQRIDSNGMILFHNYVTNNGLTSFCQIFLYPSRAGSNDASKEFNDEWNSKIALPTGIKTMPQTETEKTPEGWTIVRGTTTITQQGLTYTCMLVAISGYERVMSIRINLAGQDFLGDLDNFFKSFELDTNAKPKSDNSFSWDNYSFIPPARWYSQKTKDYILLSQTQSLQDGCLITIFPPTASSGNLETDAKNVFSQMYPGWQYRYTGEQHDVLSRGYTQQGLEYFMMEAPMHKMRPDGYYYDFEDGSVWVIGLGKQIVVVTGRHNRQITCFCNYQYEYWKRFFNSFTIKNATIPTDNGESVSERIIGDWKMMGSGASGEYIFAANGNYQFIGALATTTTTTSGGYEYLHIRTSGFKGDGAYHIKGNQLIFEKNGKLDDQVQFRFEKVNHSSMGWKDRLFMYKKDNNGEYEVCYEKEIR